MMHSLPASLLLSGPGRLSIAGFINNYVPVILFRIKMSSSLKIKVVGLA
jgi:hypothetical protein